MSELYSKLEQIADILKVNRHAKLWPKAPNSLSRRINEVKTNLREIGIVIDNSGVRDSKTKVKTIEIRKIPSLSSISLPDKNQAQITGDISDDTNHKLTTISSNDKIISLPKTPQNYAQNDTGNDSHDGNDTLHALWGNPSNYTHVPKVYNELKKGKTVFEVFRTGLGKQTEYHVKAIR
jgi:hypothetical protein